MHNMVPSKSACALLLVAAIGLGAAGGATAQAEETIRIGLPTKTYYPTILCETAQRQGLFAKEGITAELTIYRSGGETFEAGAAGAADLQLNSAALIAAGRKKGVMTKAVAGAALGYYGWYLMVKTNSKIGQIAELEGKRVGMRRAPAPTSWPCGPCRTGRSSSPTYRSAAAAWCRTCSLATSMRSCSIRRFPSR